MKLHTTVTRFVGALGVGAFLFAATLAPAKAAPTNAASDCPTGWFCIFADTGFTGRMLQFQNGGVELGDLNDYGFTDQAESWVNKTNYPVKMTNVRNNWPDESFTVAANTRSSDMGSWRNKIDRVTVLR